MSQARAPSRFEEGHRVRALDAARGIAVLAMFVAHGYDGWVAVEHRAGLAYRVTREIAAAAMPSFVLLAGVGLGLRMRTTASTGGDEVQVARRSAIVRGLQLVLAGYTLSLVYALLDGGLVASTLLRADALHAIGSSVAVVAALLPWDARNAAVSAGAGGAAVQRQDLVRAALVMALLLWLPTPWLTRGLQSVSGPLTYPLAVLIRVEGLTRFALLPLGALCAVGVALSVATARLASGRAALTLTALGACGAVFFASATARLVHALGGTLSSAHFAVLPNTLDGLSRSVCVLALGAVTTLHAPAVLARGLDALGRRSLWVYALHLPLCYGRLSMPLHRRLDFLEAMFAVMLLSGCAALCALWVEHGRGPQRS